MKLIFILIIGLFVWIHPVLAQAPTPTPTGAVKPGDADRDGDIDCLDVLGLVWAFDDVWSPYDWNRNWIVEIRDFNYVVANMYSR